MENLLTQSSSVFLGVVSHRVGDALGQAPCEIGPSKCLSDCGEGRSRPGGSVWTPDQVPQTRRRGRPLVSN